MRNEIANGIVAGLIGGIIFGIMMQMMTAPTPDADDGYGRQGCTLRQCGRRLALPFV